MSLIIVTCVPEGIIMASDSRQSIKIEGKTPEGKEFKVETVNSDAVTKTFLLQKQRIGISNYGTSMLADISISSHIRKFIEEKITELDDVESIPKKLIDYFKKPFPDANIGFHIAGYKKDKKSSVPYIFHCHVGKNKLERRNVKKDGSITYGATWSGAIDIITSIIKPVIVKDKNGKDKVLRAPAPIIWGAMTVQDAIGFSIYAIRTTIDTMRFQARPKIVGGDIDVLLLTADSEPRWIQKKDYKGEY